MATGDDLSEEAQSPRLRGRAYPNQDIIPGVWIRHPETGVTHLVNHQYQVKRLLQEGGKVVEPPEPATTTAQADSVVALKVEIARLSSLLIAKSEAAKDVTNASQEHNGADHSQNAADDRGPGRTESAVSGPGHPRQLRPVKG